MGYRKLVTFHSFGQDNNPVYHTNVMMAIGSTVAVVCGASVKENSDRSRLIVRPLTCP
jgi:hypothetical protein